MPILKRFAKIRAATNKPDYFTSRMLQMQKAMGVKLQELSLEHFRNVLKLSLTEKYGAWHKVPPREVTKMLDVLWKQSKFADKANYFSRRIFQEARPLFFQTPAEIIKEGTDAMEEAVQHLFVTQMSKMASSIYTHTTYFINSAYELQFRERDPLQKFKFIWQTRPDNRRTPQCELIAEKITKEGKGNGVKLDRLIKIVHEVANMVGFRKANPEIHLVPHYSCRSSISRVV